MKRLAFASALAVAALAACNPYIQAESVAPPGRSGRLDEVTGFWGLKRYRLEVSQGIALALTCYEGGPCEHMKVVSENPAIAEIRSASLAQLSSTGFGPSPYTPQKPAAAFVVIGKAPGKTRVHVTADEGKRDIVITVIAPPAPAAPATAQAAPLGRPTGPG